MKPGPDPRFWRGVRNALLAELILLGLIFGLPLLVLVIGTALGIDVP